MSLGSLWNVLLPGAGALAAGLGALVLWDDAFAALCAGAVGAVGGALLQDPEERRRARPAPSGPDGAGSAADVRIERAPRTDELTPAAGHVLLERLPIGVILVSRRGEVVFINPTAREMFGPPLESRFPVEALRAPRLLEGIEAVRATGEPQDVHFVRSRLKTSHLCAHVVALGAERRGSDPGSAPAILLAVEDRTQARRAEELHRDFVANASHELKTPLAAVSGIIETLQGHARDDADAQERFLAIMAAQTERMKRLVEDLLSLNRIELNERVHPQEPQPLHRLVHEVVETLRPIAERADVRLVAPPPADEPVVAGERDELVQVFMNLVENAIKYGGSGGEVRLVPLTGAQDRVGMVGIAVEDDGPGIAREHLPRLTERFYRVSASSSRERGGTGLGLAIVKHILNRHRGRLEIESRVGRGSRFTVWLPSYGTRAPRGAASAEARIGAL